MCVTQAVGAWCNKAAATIESSMTEDQVVQLLLCIAHKCMSSLTGASTPKKEPLIMGRFCVYAICSLSSNVLEQTILPSAELTTTPPQLQDKMCVSVDAGHDRLQP